MAFESLLPGLVDGLLLHDQPLDSNHRPPRFSGGIACFNSPAQPITLRQTPTLSAMIAVVQRVSEASVTISGLVKSHIRTGFLVLLGITHTDSEEDVDWLSRKIVGMRIFNDDEGKMNLGLTAVGGSILLISQFTLHASTKRGNRPGFTEAARPEIAIPLYEAMIARLSAELGKPVQTGEFGADMQVSLLNDGPVTIIIDSKNRI